MTTASTWSVTVAHLESSTASVASYENAPEQLGDEARVGATLAVAHVEIPRPRGVPYRPKRGYRETGMGDDKRRPYAPNSSATKPA